MKSLLTAEEIKEKCEEQYAQIKKSEETLGYLRSICLHKNQIVGLYSYRIGAIMNAEICSDCGTCIKIL